MTFEIEDREFFNWQIALKPRVQREGEFREEHVYEKTQEKHTIIFSCERNILGVFTCSTLGIEKKRR
jgi:hypothetical protein